MNNYPKHTALTLLEKVIEFTGMTNDSSEWTFEEQRGNPPRLVRLQQIHSLMKAFVPELMSTKDIQWSIKNFYTGNFITHRSVEDYSELIVIIDKTIEESRFRGARKEKLDVYDLRSNYCDLMDYYLKLKSLLNHNHSLMEISYSDMFSYIITDSISGSIYSETETISKLLREFIDPGGHSFTEEELIEQFRYPVVDLQDMDLDWM